MHLVPIELNHTLFESANHEHNCYDLFLRKNMFQVFYKCCLLCHRAKYYLQNTPLRVVYYLNNSLCCV